MAGLTLCAALRQHGVEAEVFEREERWRHGAGIWLPPNALQALQELGVSERLLAAGESLQRIDLSDLHHGLLQSLSLVPFVERFGFPILAVHRRALHQVLLDVAGPAHVHLGSTPTNLEYRDGTWTLHFASCEPVRTTLLLGADGIHSALRQGIAPHSRVRYSGQGCYRTVVRATLPESERGSSQEIWAPGRRFGYSSLGGGLVYWYATFDAPAHQRPATPEAQRAHALALAREFSVTVRELVETTPAEAVLFNEIEDLPQPVWSGDDVILLGDAAHAVTPNLGQGGAQAIEDALFLAKAIQADPRTAASRYRAARQQRVQNILRQAYRLGRAAHLHNAFLRRLRNVALRHYPARAQGRQLTALFTVSGREEP
jgi:2-polyprenyl-6-methoxyphenol hydroxylase-like FAD-dependent oxidoreductase